LLGRQFNWLSSGAAFSQTQVTFPGNDSADITFVASLVAMA